MVIYAIGFIKKRGKKMKKQLKSLVILCLSLVISAPLLASDEPLPIDQLSAFSEAFRRIKSQYVEPIDDRILLEGAIKGMMETLDPHSRYLSANSMIDLEASATGEYSGLGIEVAADDGKIIVMRTIEGAPADRDGVQQGDEITEINNLSVQGMSLEESLGLMQGESGEKINLTLVRQEQPAFTVSLVRELIQIKSVSAQLLTGKVGYVQVEQFQMETATELEEGIKKMKKEASSRLSGLILDLRNNPGGVLSAAVEVSDLFLNKGLIVSTKGRMSISNNNHYATFGDILDGSPLVVLINGGSASASEIVAGALQDQNRAVLMGTRSFGKGSVQTVWDLADNSGIKLTTARYYTPSGKTIQGHGVEPDLEVFAGTFVKEENKEIHESDLPNTLTNTHKDFSLSKTKPLKYTDEGLVKNDNQLREALHALQAMVLSSNLKKKHTG